MILHMPYTRCLGGNRILNKARTDEDQRLPVMLARQDHIGLAFLKKGTYFCRGSYLMILAQAIWIV